MHHVTQEQIAEELGMSRQRFARIEKGLSDISYDVIVAISDFLKINPKEITDICETTSLTSFRAGNSSAETFSKVEEIISFFYANKSLYNRMSAENIDELQ
jgi:transcriptional regulator with XRE-family HTH domain